MGDTKTTGRPPSKGRQRIVIAHIANKDRRLVTFSKRKAGFFKKASETAVLCGARIAVVLFSDAGKVYAFGSPSVDSVLRRLALLPGVDDGSPDAPYLEDDDDNRATVEPTLRRAEETTALVAKEQARMAAVGEKVMQDVTLGRQFWWEADVRLLGVTELPEFTKAFVRLRNNVQRHADKLRSDALPSSLPVQ